jgi:hypothetical protein
VGAESASSADGQLDDADRLEQMAVDAGGGAAA